VQPVTPDIDQCTWCRKPPRRGSAGGALVKHARRDERGEHTGEKG
jgi:hypothetical protein